MKENERKYGALLLPIILVLIAFMAFNVFCVSGYFASASDGAVKVVAQNRFGKVGYVEGLDELRKKYFNSAVSENVFKPASFDGDRWVIVELDGDALYDEFKSSAYADFSAYCKTDEADKVRNTLVLGQNEFLSLLDENGIDYEFKYSYTTLTNGVAVKVNSGAYNLISGMTGVKRVYFSESYATPSVATVNNANVYTTGIYDSSDLSYQGEGMVVAVLDTGLDYAHEAFAHMPTNPAWSKEDVASKMASSLRFNAKATADEVYYNAKVPYAYDYADDDPDVYPSYSTHGTHVAGIVGGKSDYVVNEVTGEKFIGVAPEAQLVICKVFTDNLDSHSLGGADTTDIIAAVSDCVELGVDVINMSLGSSAGFADEKSNSAVNEVYSRVKEAGISLVVAASNDYSSGFGGGNGTNLASNPDSATVGSPSTYEAALSVASINGQKATYIQANNDENQVAFITASSDENGNEYKFTELLYEKAGKDPSQTLNYKYVVIGGVGRATSYNAAIKREINNKSGYDGVIALIKRGDTTFAEKVQTAMNNGVDACIIYNNVSGTIRMSLGDVENPVPTCSISMDAGKVFVENAVRSVGSIQIDSSFMAGPFMSDFSSWGPLPDLQLKPEITAHGGEITSAVPGGYDIYSGTSMAAPNMAGAIALLRQYLKDTTSLSGTDLNARINQVLMSTATIALNEEGNPYSPRKQGAGLAGIADAINTESYLSVFDSENNERDKTKIELFDDKKKKGVYELDFVINNVSGKAESYEPVTYVMTETLASDNKTVAEKAHMLSDSRIVYYVNGVEHSGKIAVPANAKVSVRVVITLGSVGRKYLDDSFENGMYVEGFVSLKAVDDTKVTIGLPYLAFYGDWNDAPLFDYDTYELAASKMDTGVPEEDKLKASAADTRPLGMYYDDKYIIELGAYLYAMDESEVAIYPTKEKAAVSIYDSEGRRTIYEMYMVYAGLLRNAAYMSVEVSDAVTGEILYAELKENISKSYAAGGSNRGAPIMLEIKPDEWGLVNNSTYIVKLKGQLDYPGGENPDRNTFDFQFTVDYEAPQMLDYRIRIEPYKDENK
ncbi:MAG: S8 family serine peptidase [Christensenellales bacterium]